MSKLLFMIKDQSFEFTVLIEKCILAGRLLSKILESKILISTTANVLNRITFFLNCI